MGETAADGPTSGVALLRWGGLAALVVLAVLQLAVPFSGDQALFTLMGEQLRHGDVLYADLWDVKQPVLYLWYSGAGRLFGADEVGVHLAEAIWLLGFAAALPRLLRGHVASARTAALAPLLIVGAYLLVAEPLDRTQAEALAGPLLFLACWFGVTSHGTDRRRLVAAGAFVALATMMKVTMGPLAVSGLLVVLATGPLRRGAWWRRALPVVGWSLLGFAAVLLVLGAWLASIGALDDLVELVFEYLPGSGSRNGRDLGTLRHTFVRFGLMYLPLGLLALLAAWRRLRPSTWSGEPPRLLLAMATWTVLMVPMSVAQNGWKYLPQVAVVPLGVLAAEGLDLLLRRTPSSRRTTSLVVAGLACLVPLALAAPKWSTLAGHGFGVDGDERLALAAEDELAYQRGAALRDEVTVPGDLFVVGNPLLNRMTGRPLATRVHAWSPGQLRQQEWDDLLADLQDDDPPAVVVVSDPFRDALSTDQPAVLRAVEQRWCEVGGYGTDTWYVRPDLLDTDGRC